jgi:hypothetical protein
MSIYKAVPALREIAFSPVGPVEPVGNREPSGLAAHDHRRVRRVRRVIRSFSGIVDLTKLHQDSLCHGGAMPIRKGPPYSDIQDERSSKHEGLTVGQ